MADHDDPRKCPHCRQPVAQQARVCGNCGRPLTDDEEHAVAEADGPVCRNCGEQIRPGMLRCRSCGEPVNSAEKPGNKAQLVDPPSAGTESSEEQPAEPENVVAEEPSSAAAAEETEETASTSSTSPLRASVSANVTRPTQKPMKATLAVLAVIFAVAVVGVGFWMWSSRLVISAELLRQWKTERSEQRLISLAGGIDQQEIYAGTADGEVYVWQRGRRGVFGRHSLAEEPIISLLVTPDQFLMAGDAKGNLAGWQPDIDESTQFPNMSSAVNALAVRPGRVEFAVGWANGQIGIFGKKETRVIKSGHRGGLKSICYHPDGRWLVTTGADGLVQFWNDESGKRFFRETAHDAETPAAAFRADGKQLATGDWNGTIVLWKTETKPERSLVLTQPDAVADLLYLGENFVTGSWDGKLRFWSGESGKLLAQVQTGRPVLQLIAGPDGRTILTVSGDNAVREWALPVLRRPP